MWGMNRGSAVLVMDIAVRKESTLVVWCHSVLIGPVTAVKWLSETIFVGGILYLWYSCGHINHGLPNLFLFTDRKWG